MIKIYGMETCPDCTYVEEQVKDNDNYQIVDIGRHVKYLKEFCGCATACLCSTRRRRRVQPVFPVLCWTTVR